MFAIIVGIPALIFFLIGTFFIFEVVSVFKGFQSQTLTSKQYSFGKYSLTISSVKEKELSLVIKKRA